MKRYVVIAWLALGCLLANGCATKKYVRKTVAPVQAKVDQVGDQTAQNAKGIEDAHNRINYVDERAQAGISSAQERAVAADQRATAADQRAGEAIARANLGVQKAEQAGHDVRHLAENFDNYTLQASESVLFRFNQATLTADARRRLDQLAAEVKANNRVFVTVEGFTDSVGSRSYNEALSRRRADTVVHYLVSVDHIPIYRIHVIGLGEDKPVAPGRSAAARAQNRRVELKVFSADGVAASLTSQSGERENRYVLLDATGGATASKQ